MTKRKSRDLKLAPGRYLAKCHEDTIIKAALNGHSLVWPQAEMVIQGDAAGNHKPDQK